MTNDLNKLNAEHDSTLKNKTRVWLRIRMTAGMEALAQEINNGRRIFESDLSLPSISPEFTSPGGNLLPSPLDHMPPGLVSPEVFSPAYLVSPVSPVSPPYFKTVSKMRSKHWNVDATGVFPCIFLPEEMVIFYSNTSELKQAIAEQQPGEREKLILNIANVISIEKVLVTRVYAQNTSFDDVRIGVRFHEPPEERRPLTVILPETIQPITKPEQELFFPVVVKDGIEPYRYTMMNQPTDLYITEDGWVRGFIEASQWPTSGYRDFFMVITVEDSSLPRRSVGVEFRYRLHAPA